MLIIILLHSAGIVVVIFKRFLLVVTEPLHALYCLIWATKSFHSIGTFWIFK